MYFRQINDELLKKGKYTNININIPLFISKRMSLQMIYQQIRKKKYCTGILIYHLKMAKRNKIKLQKETQQFSSMYIYAFLHVLSQEKTTYCL